MIEDFFGKFTLPYNNQPLEYIYRGIKPDKIILGEFRPIARSSANDYDSEYSIDFSVFIEDVKVILYFMSLYDFEYDEVIKLKVMYHVCQWHIDRFGQIIIDDLEIQIDELMFLCIRIEHEVFDMDEQLDTTKLWFELYNYCVEKFNVLKRSSNNPNVFNKALPYKF